MCLGWRKLTPSTCLLHKSLIPESSNENSNLPFWYSKPVIFFFLLEKVVTASPAATVCACLELWLPLPWFLYWFKFFCLWFFRSLSLSFYYWCPFSYSRVLINLCVSDFFFFFTLKSMFFWEGEEVSGSVQFTLLYWKLNHYSVLKRKFIFLSTWLLNYEFSTNAYSLD